MGYQRVVKPKFYIDIMSYLHSTGHSEYFDNAKGTAIEEGSIADLLYGNTSSLLRNTMGNGGSFATYSSEAWESNKVAENCFPTFNVDFVALLNHNFEGGEFYVGFKNADDTGEISLGSSSLPFDYDKSINIEYQGGDVDLQEFNGFSIGVTESTLQAKEKGRMFIYCSPDDTWDNGNGFSLGDRYCGSVMVGKTYSPPHSPNLSMTVSRSFDGIKSSKTKGGHTISNIDHLGNPDWAGHNAWELWKYPTDPKVKNPNINPDDTQQNAFIQDPKLNLGRLGRRSWKLTFDLVSEQDIFGAWELTNQNPLLDVSNYPDGTGSTFGMKGYDNPFLEEDNFISSVWTKTLGGTIPMIMQIDDSHTFPDNYALVTIKQNSFSVTPKAPNLYSYSMTLEETW